MEFNPNHKVKIETMNTTEARAFLAFLNDEKTRHITNQDECEHVIQNAEDRFPHDTEGEIMVDTYREFYHTAIIRHQGDVDDIEILLRQVKDMFKL